MTSGNSVPSSTVKVSAAKSRLLTRIAVSRESDATGCWSSATSSGPAHGEQGDETTSTTPMKTRKVGPMSDWVKRVHRVEDAASGS